MNKYDLSLGGILIGYGLRVQSWLKLQVILNSIQRTFKLEFLKDRRDLNRFRTLEAVEEYVDDNFEYSADEILIGDKVIGIDYVTNVRITQYTLDKRGVFDGDCDDIHYWVVAVAEMMYPSKQPRTLSVKWKGGGHTMALVYHEQEERWKLFDYELVDIPEDVENPSKWIIDRTLERYAEGGKLTYFCTQDSNLNMIDINRDFI